MDPATLLREARLRNGIGQAALARRARTSQAQISRIERGEISPSVATLSRLLAAMSERLELASAPMPHGNRSDADARADAALDAAARVAQAAALSRALTSIASTPRCDALTLLRVLRDHGVDFVVIDGFSLAAHGYVRGMKDVDIVPDPAAANLRRLVEALRALEAKPDEAGLAGGGNWVLETVHGRLDVMQDVPGAPGYEALRARAVAHDVPEAGPLAFAGLDDLIAMKRAAGRPQDLIDIAELERSRRQA